jgi:hypothetical protein
MYERSKRSTIREKAALLSLVATVAGGIAVEGTQADASVAPQQAATRLEHGPIPKIVPPGVHNLVRRDQINSEINYALMNMHKRANVVFVLHAPKTNSLHSFNESPRAYSYPVNNHSYGKGDKGADVTVAPALEIYKDRLYAAAFSKNISGESAGEMGFLDVKWAMDNGALDVYPIKGKKVSAFNYDFTDDPEHPPLLGEFPASYKESNLGKMPIFDDHMHFAYLVPKKLSYSQIPKP